MFGWFNLKENIVATSVATTACLVYQRGKFLNVPLIGIKGCINYNLVLAQRQFGYPIRGTPTSYILKPLLHLYEDDSAAKILPSIWKAWEKKVIMGKDTRPYVVYGKYHINNGWRK